MPTSSPPAIQETILEVRRSVERLPLRLVGSEEIKAFLKDLDSRRGLIADSGRLLQQGRELHLGLKLKDAIEAYRGAAKVLESGFAQYYDPGLLAQPILQLGAALFQSDQKDEARKAFQRVAALVPTLELSEGYFSPSVREAFNKAKGELGPLQPGIPFPAEIGRITAATGLKGMVVIAVEKLGDRPLLRVGLYDSQRQGFCAMETAVVEEPEAATIGRSLGERLEKALAGMTGIAQLVTPPRETPDGGTGADTGPPPPPPDPWYVRHWWIWPAAAVVIGTAVVLPLTVFRRDVIDVRVHY